MKLILSKRTELDAKQPELRCNQRSLNRTRTAARAAFVLLIRKGSHRGRQKQVAELLLSSITPLTELG
jgi:hypothetical protein